MQCKPYVSYLRTNPYTPGGCASCMSVVTPVGTYADSISCINWRTCINAPPNAIYTTASSEIGVSKCNWTCNTGYYLAASTCSPCAYVGFNATVHQPTTGCLFGCKPRFYSDSALECNQPCIDLFLEYSSGSIQIAPRVTDYYSNNIIQRPRYIQRVCGTDDETIPFSSLPFLRRGRWLFFLLHFF